MLRKIARGVFRSRCVRIVPCVAAIWSCSAAGGSQPDTRATGGSTGQTQLGPCAKPSGSYKVTFALDSGNCGPQSSAVADLSKPDVGVGTVGGACQGQGTVSPDGCKYQATSTCPLTLTAYEQRILASLGGPIPVSTVTASTTWDEGADSAQGLWELVKDATMSSGPACSGTYVVTYTRL